MRFLASEEPLHGSKATHLSGLAEESEECLFVTDRTQYAHRGVPSAKALHDQDLKAPHNCRRKVLETHRGDSPEPTNQTRVHDPTQSHTGVPSALCAGKEFRYRGTSLMRNTHTPRITLGP